MIEEEFQKHLFYLFTDLSNTHRVLPMGRHGIRCIDTVVELREMLLKGHYNGRDRHTRRITTPQDRGRQIGPQDQVEAKANCLSGVGRR